MRSLSTDLVFPLGTLVKRTGLPEPGSKDLLEAIQVIGDLQAPLSGATRKEVQGVRSMPLSEASIVEGSGSNRNLK
jgi:hypothetical protein